MQSNRASIQETHRVDRAPFEPASRGGFTARPMPRPLTPATQSGAPCPVCRCTAVFFDEVEAGAGLGLAECPRCDHRWTTPGKITSGVRTPSRVAFVAASRLDRAAQA